MTRTRTDLTSNTQASAHNRQISDYAFRSSRYSSSQIACPDVATVSSPEFGDCCIDFQLPMFTESSAKCQRLFLASIMFFERTRTLAKISAAMSRHGVPSPWMSSRAILTRPFMWPAKLPDAGAPQAFGRQSWHRVTLFRQCSNFASIWPPFSTKTQHRRTILAWIIFSAVQLHAKSNNIWHRWIAVTAVRPSY